MYLFITVLLLLLIIFLLSSNEKKIKEKFSNKRIACFPKKKNTEIKSFRTEYPDKYGIINDIPDVTESLVAKNEGNYHVNHINYKNSPINNKLNGLPLPNDYLLIDRDFHTPLEGSEIISTPPVYNLARVDNTNYFLVDTPNSIWRRVVPIDSRL
jgi:hypothetical protein